MRASRFCWQRTIRAARTSTRRPVGLEAPASSIGLEAYRHLARADALESGGKAEAALAEARLAFAAEGPFAFRVHAAIVVARLLEKRREYREAAQVLALASDAAATPNQVAEVCIARIRLGMAGGDRAAVKDAARVLILESPTTDSAKGTPAFVRQAAAEAERSLTPAERGRRGSALVAAGQSRAGVRLLSLDRPAAWPEGERSRNLLALAQGQLAMKKPKDAEATAARIADDGTLAAAQARLLRCDIVVTRLRGKDKAPLAHDDPRLAAVRQALDALTAPTVPVAVRRGAEERLVKLDAEGEDFDAAIARARELTSDAPATIDGFEPLWLAAWRRYLAGDYAAALARLDAMTLLYTDISRSRRLAYWRARCLAVGGKQAEARALFERLAAATPPDIYARFSRLHAPAAAGPRAPGARRPVHRDGGVRAGRRAAAPSNVRGGVGRGAHAAALARAGICAWRRRSSRSDASRRRRSRSSARCRRSGPPRRAAFPRRGGGFYYPIEEGGLLAARAKAAEVDPAVLRGLVRQESVFDARAKSHAGAVGLMQLMPGDREEPVALGLYTRATVNDFLYDPDSTRRSGRRT